MFALRVIWGEVCTWATNNIWWLFLVFIVGAVVFLIGDIEKRESVNRQEFMDWCKEEYADEGHKDLDRYCKYLHRGKVIR